MRLRIAIAFLIVAIVFGGGGSPSPWPELVVQLSALLALAVWVISTARAEAVRVADRPFWICIALLVLLPLLQLIPLPPAMWAGLPGRESTRVALDVVGAAGTWRPLSLAPFDTLSSLLSLIPPVVAAFLVSQLTTSDRTRFIGAIAVMAAVSAMVGVIQLAGGQDHWMRFYTHTHFGFATGFQANRNATADVLLIGLIALGAIAASRLPLTGSLIGRLLVAAIGLFLVLTVVLTGSRAGTLLLGACAPVLFAFFVRYLRSWRTGVIAIVGAVVLAAGLAGVLSDNTAVRRTMDRFAETEIVRPDLWMDTKYAVGRYWPAGAGVGTFKTVFASAERLEVVDEATPNRAHEDFLEFVFEAGAAAPMLLLFLSGMLGWRWIELARDVTPQARRTQAIFGTGTLAILALHSLVDYPLRSMSLAVLAASAAAMFSRLPADRNTGRSVRRGGLGWIGR